MSYLLVLLYELKEKGHLVRAFTFDNESYDHPPFIKDNISIVIYCLIREIITCSYSVRNFSASG